MNAMYNQALRKYTEVGVQTGVASASPQQLIVMLYDGALAAIGAAQQHLRVKNIRGKCEAISKATDIVDRGLKASLDMNVGGDLAQHLSDLYDYMVRRLVHANMKNDAAALEEVRQLLLQLAESWRTLAARPLPAAEHAPAPATQRLPSHSYGSI